MDNTQQEEYYEIITPIKCPGGTPPLPSGNSCEVSTLNPTRQTHYKIQRPCMWFAKGDIVTRRKLRKYFTRVAVKDLEKYGFITIFEETKQHGSTKEQ